MFLGYPDGVKGYKLWCLEDGFKKCIISRDVIFNEKVMAMKENVATDSISKVSTSNQIQVDISQREINESVTTQATRDETTRRDELDDYLLARDRTRRETKAPERFVYADFTKFALAAASEIDNSEPSTYLEATSCKDRVK